MLLVCFILLVSRGAAINGHDKYSKFQCEYHVISFLFVFFPFLAMPADDRQYILIFFLCLLFLGFGKLLNYCCLNKEKKMPSFFFCLFMHVLNSDLWIYHWNRVEKHHQCGWHCRRPHQTFYLFYSGNINLNVVPKSLSLSFNAKWEQRRAPDARSDIHYILCTHIWLQALYYVFCVYSR